MMKINVITVKELESLELSNIIQCKLENKNLNLYQREIENKNKQLKKSLGLRQTPISLNFYNNRYYLKFSGISGSLRLFNTDIEIIPKFINNKINTWRKSFFNMIDIAHRKWQISEKIKYVKYENLNFYDHIALSFIDSFDFIDTYDNIRSYSNEIEETPFLKGRLLINEQFKKVITNPGIFVCEYDFFNTENEFNFLLTWAINLLKSKVKSNIILARLLNLEEIIPKVSKQYLLPVTTILPPQYKNYENSIQIANSLALGLSMGNNIGPNSGYGYVVNTEKIYEGFIENLLKMLANTKNGLTVESQKSKIFANATTSEESNFYTVPDNLLFINSKLEMLIDAKYKRTLSSEVNKRPVNSDLYQMFASLVSHDCKKALLITPKEEDSFDAPLSIWTIQNGNEKVFIASLSLDISDLSTKSSIKKLISKLESSINEFRDLE